jgi:PilZ domain
MRERRKIQRTNVVVLAHIILPDSSVVDCAVRDLTSISAGIEITAMVKLPDDFELSFDAGHTRRPCRVVWHAVNRMGVEFLKPKASGYGRPAFIR